MKSFFKEEFRIYVQILMSYQIYIHVWVCVWVCVCVCVRDRLYIVYEVLAFKLALFSFSIPISKTPKTLNPRS